MKKKFLSVLFALVLVCSLCLVTAVPVGAQATLEVVPFGLGGATAEWDLTYFTNGSCSVHLATGGSPGVGDEARIVIDASQVGVATLSDLISISWYEYNVAGYPPHVDVKIDTDNDDVADDALVFEYAYNGHIGEGQPTYGALTGQWYQTFDDDTLGPAVIGDTAYAWLTTGPAGGPNIVGGTLSEWKNGTVDASSLGKSVDGSTAVISFEIEVDNWMAVSEAYVDEIEVNGVVYYGSIQDAIDDAAPSGDTINVAAGTYDLTAPIVVDESVTLTGDTTTPSNVIINALAGGADRDCFQVKASNVTIQGFKMQGALDAGSQNAGVMIGTHWVGPAIKGLHTIDISYNEFVDCSKGIFMYHVKDSTVSYNTFTTTEGETIDNFTDEVGWGGDAVHVYLWDPSDYPTGNTISHNTMDNVRVGVFLNGDTIAGTDPSAWDFSGTTIEDNTMTNVWNAGIVLQCASGTAESPIIININNIDTSTGRRAGDEGNERGLISVKGDYTEITGNTLTNSEGHGLWVDGSHHMVEGNIVTSNTKDGIHVGWYKEVEPVNGWTLPEITRTDITISTNTLENVGPNAAAILVQGGGSIDILDNPISDFVKGGIVVKDVLSVQIEGNIISTTNYSAAPNGIQVGYVMDYTLTTGTVKGNQVSGCQWEGYDPTKSYEYYEEGVFINWTGSGILVIAPNSALEISGNEVQSCDVGLDIETGSGTSIENNDVHNNSYGFVLWNADPTLSFNNIYQNALYGVYRTSGLTGILNATDNWWGNASGPIPTGTYDSYGDKVSAKVKYEPWLLEGVDIEDPAPTIYDKTLALKDGWTLISVDEAVAEPIWVGTNPLAIGQEAIMALKYTPTSGFVSEVTPADLQPLTAIYVLTKGGGGIGFNYAADGDPAFYSKDLEAGWNLISIPDMGVAIYDILSPLRYVTIGTQQGVGLTTLVSQGDYNQFSESFYEATLTEADWGELPPLEPFDGYWANMEGAEKFEVPIP